MLKNTHKPMPENCMQNWLRDSSLDIITKEMWPKLNSLGHHVWGNVRGLPQVASKTEDKHKTQGNAVR